MTKFKKASAAEKEGANLSIYDPADEKSKLLWGMVKELNDKKSYTDQLKEDKKANHVRLIGHCNKIMDKMGLQPNDALKAEDKGSISNVMKEDAKIVCDKEHKVVKHVKRVVTNDKDKAFVELQMNNCDIGSDNNVMNDENLFNTPNTTASSLSNTSKDLDKKKFNSRVISDPNNNMVEICNIMKSFQQSLLAPPLPTVHPNAIMGVSSTVNDEIMAMEKEIKLQQLQKAKDEAEAMRIDLMIKKRQYEDMMRG